MEFKRNKINTEFKPTHTVGYFITDDKILLGQHQRGVSQGFWNGYGGKIELGESPEQSLVRECQEECGLVAMGFDRVTSVESFLGDKVLRLYIYMITDWVGELVETPEMKPQWFNVSKIPYDKMWPSDGLWLPRVLSGENLHVELHFDIERNLLSSSVITQS